MEKINGASPTSNSASIPGMDLAYVPDTLERGHTQPSPPCALSHDRNSTALELDVHVCPGTEFVYPGILKVYKFLASKMGTHSDLV